MESPGPTGHWFTTTHWSVVLFAGAKEQEASHRALATLCESYRAPILSYARRILSSPADAEDLTQSFFAHLIESNMVSGLQRRPGVKFRSFLLTCFKNFLSDQRDKEAARKRGGGHQFISFDEPALSEAAGCLDPNSPEIVYEREWASALLAGVLSKLEAEYRERGRSAVYARFHEHLVHKRSSTAYPDLARALGISAEAVRKEVSRMRQRYRELFCEEIAGTVSHPSEVPAEVRYLMRVLST